MDPAKHPGYSTVSSTIRTVVSESGVMSLFSGLTPRAFRIVGAAFILNGSRNKSIELVEGFKSAGQRS